MRAMLISIAVAVLAAAGGQAEARPYHHPDRHAAARHHVSRVHVTRAHHRRYARHHGWQRGRHHGWRHRPAVRVCHWRNDHRVCTWRQRR